MTLAVFDPLYLAQVFLFSSIGLLLLAASGAPLVAVVCERLAVTHKRVFFDKLANQIATMGLVFGLGTLPFPLLVWLWGWAGNWFYLLVKHPNLELPAMSLKLAGSASLTIVAVYALALAFLAAYCGAWKSLKNSKAAHSFLGLLAATLGLLALVLFLAYKRAALHEPDLAIAGMPIQTLFIQLTATPALSLLWPTMVAAVLFALAATGGLGLVYLLMRRNTEDFGRDYYTFALRHCARWATTPILISALAFAWGAVVHSGRLGDLTVQNPKLQYLAASIVCLLLADTSWTLVARSQTPLRQKPAVILGLLFLLLGLTALAAFFRLSVG